jgi:hypothetical protein
MKRKCIVVFFTATLLIASNYITKNESVAAKKPPELVALQSLNKQFNNIFFIKDVAASYSNEQAFYFINTDKTISVHKREANHNFVYKKFFSHTRTPESIAVDKRGRIYIADLKGNQIVVLNPKGEVINKFFSPRPHSLAVLSNGNVVIASPHNGRLLHLYDNDGGYIQSFGDVKTFDESNRQQNNFLNRGKVVTDPNDNIYFIFRYALKPGVLKYTKKGKFVLEFFVQGEAIDVQAEMGARYLKTLKSTGSHNAGGVTIITSASIDPQSGNLWVSTNGTTTAGNIYEYSSTGEKVKEYALVDSSIGNILGVKHIIVDGPVIYIFTSNSNYRFRSDHLYMKGSGSILPQAACAPDLGWGTCTTPCNTPETTDDEDCVATLQASVNTSNHHIVVRNCTQDPTQCILDIQLCNITTMAITHHDTTQNCAGEECEFAVCEDPFNWDMQECCCAYGGSCHSPILIDVLGNGFNLTNAADGVNFDVNSDGVAERLSWTSLNSDDAWLVLDRNGNGRIDNGQELFGNYTPQPPSAEMNGFLALAEYDNPANGGNNDDKISGADAIFTSLRLWQDTNRNGISEEWELHPLLYLNVVTIDLDYKKSKKADQQGNLYRYRAKVRDAQGASVGRWAWDVYLLKQ